MIGISITLFYLSARGEMCHMVIVSLSDIPKIGKEGMVMAGRYDVEAKEQDCYCIRVESGFKLLELSKWG